MGYFTVLIGIGVLTLAMGCHGAYDYSDYTDHPCARTCEDGGLPRMCEYTFVLENYWVLGKACFDCPRNTSDCFRPQCVSGDGMSRGIKTVNRMIPGPGIQICEGDTVKVTVDNHMEVSEDTSIHWHGLKQRGTPFMDGVGLVTQCPITFMSTFTYQFTPSTSGTHFWHAHSGMQRMDGLFGSFIVRRPPKFETHKNLYDYDLPEHVVTVTDWLNEYSINRFAHHHYSDGDNKPGSILINGRGALYPVPVDGTNHMTPRATFTVAPGKKYRFRFISAGIMNCPIQISIDNHTLLMISSDGHDFEPYNVESFNIFAGERFDFILHTHDTAKGNFWIRARGIGDCSVKSASQTAILHYEGISHDVVPEGETTWAAGDREGKMLNPMNNKGDDMNVPISRMLATDTDDDWMKKEPTKKYYLGMDFHKIDNPKFNDLDLYPMHTVSRDNHFYTPQVNDISAVLPASPPLSQYDDVQPSEYCNAETVQKQCENEWCECIHLYKVDLGDIVELIVIDEGVTYNANHPMHLHGFTFRVMGMDRLGNSTSREEVKAKDARGELARATTKAPVKDTVTIPDGGYTIIRFLADNPGIWFFHCHIEFHAEIGMGLLFQVGERSDFPEKPKGFPLCGNFHGDHRDKAIGQLSVNCPAAGHGSILWTDLVALTLLGAAFMAIFR